MEENFSKKISIVDEEWTIYLDEDRDYDSETEKGILYGECNIINRTIFVYINNINKNPGMTIGRVLAHELGHAFSESLPSHTLWTDGSDAIAEAFEKSYCMYDKIKGVLNDYKSFKKQIKKNKK